MKRSLLAAFLLLATLGANAKTVEFPEEVGKTFKVSVSEGESPVHGEVYVNQLPGGKLVRKTELDAHGSVDFVGFPEGEYLIASSANAPYAWSVLVKVTSGSLIRSVDVDLPGKNLPSPISVSAVEGVVSDASGARVAGAVIVVEKTDAARTPVAASTAGQDGTFTLKVSPGLYHLRIAYPGFYTLTQPIIVVRDKNKSSVMNITLRIRQVGFLIDVD